MTASAAAMTAWFGQPWGAPVNSHVPRSPVPAGLPCADCHVQITEDDQGLLIPQTTYSGGKLSGTGALVPVHLACFLRSIGADQ